MLHASSPHEHVGLYRGRQKRSQRCSSPVSGLSSDMHTCWFSVKHMSCLSLNGCRLCSPTGFPCFSSWADSTDAFHSWVTGTVSWNTKLWLNCNRGWGSPVKLYISVRMTEQQWSEAQTDRSSLDRADDRLRLQYRNHHSLKKRMACLKLLIAEDQKWVSAILGCHVISLATLLTEGYI